MSKISIGDIIESNNYGKFKVIDKYKEDNKERYVVEFLLTGYIKTISRSTIERKEIRDPYYPIYNDVACIGEADIKKYKKEFSVWRGIIDRCYNVRNLNYKTYGGNGVYVCKSWLCFENFLKDIPFIEGYDEILFYSGKIVIDKDIKSNEDNRRYSLETCKFISQSENFQERNNRQKEHTSSKYLGVSKLKCGKWQSTLCYKGKRIYIGRFDTEEDAYIAYENKKKEFESIQAEVVNK